MYRADVRNITDVSPANVASIFTVHLSTVECVGVYMFIHDEEGGRMYTRNLGRTAHINEVRRDH
jgi:hypothetical protein